MTNYDLINELRDQAEVIGPGTEYHLLMEAADVIEALDFLKTETAKKGASEWVEDSDPGQEYGTTWACFKCRRSLHMPYIWNPIKQEWRYCPHCGRRMTEDGEMGDEQVD